CSRLYHLIWDISNMPTPGILFIIFLSGMPGLASIFSLLKASFSADSNTKVYLELCAVRLTFSDADFR
ncbi:MAG: hypothetical protein K8R53_12905, partial [Bacteroidales bacterium]|nr:hypothetical protein [Bacteroidales bacterium]